MSTITKILIIEDDPCYRFILERFLKEFSQNLSIHSSAESAVATIERGEKFDVILSDFNLPGRNGDFLLKKLRERGDDTPYIILSGNTDICEDSLGIRSMVNKILNKAEVCKDELITIIKSVLALAVSIEGNKKKILVADDDPLNIEAVESFLDDSVYEVISTKNGKRACELAERELPDLIILDWKMPVMGGIEAAGIISSNPLTKDVPIIMSTDVMTKVEHLEKALDNGVADFLSKPFDRVEFRARLNASLRLKAQNDEIRELLSQEKKHFKEALELKEKELSTIAIYDYEKNLLLEKVAVEIRKIEDRMKTKGCNIEVLQNLRKKLRYQLNLEGSWRKFRKHFEQVHSSFFERLQKKHPALNPNDVKICAYIKTGLDNAEMSQLVGIETSSVRKALNRLKQKLRLSNHIGLREYIQTL
jgi:CheY-like chemotaxis protein/DNA-binding CsgD family transcriptional regulator